jgi:hypothetical protein
LALAPDSVAQINPLAAQKRATERIDPFVGHVRITADIETLAPDLALAQQELAESNRALAGTALLHVTAMPEYGHPYFWAAFSIVER